MIDSLKQHKEGWGLVDCIGSADGTPQLQSIDEVGIFNDDTEAWEYVWNKAFIEHSKEHFEVFKTLFQENPNEFNKIINYIINGTN